MTRNWLGMLRKQLGWAQQTLAAFLDVSRSQVAMAERKYRQLPTAALIKVSELQQWVAATPDTTEWTKAELDRQQQELRQTITAHREEQAHTLKLLERQLAACQQEYTAALRSLGLTRKLLQDEALPKPARLLLELETASHLRKLRQNSLSIQWQLQRQIAAAQLKTADAPDM